MLEMLIIAMSGKTSCSFIHCDASIKNQNVDETNNHNGAVEVEENNEHDNSNSTNESNDELNDNEDEDNEDDREYPCDICHKIFENTEDLIEHWHESGHIDC